MAGDECLDLEEIVLTGKGFVRKSDRVPVLVTSGDNWQMMLFCSSKMNNKARQEKLISQIWDAIANYNDFTASQKFNGYIVQATSPYTGRFSVDKGRIKFTEEYSRVFYSPVVYQLAQAGKQ
jgi:hypothetical protein